MKAKLLFTVILTSFFLFMGCSSNDNNAEELESVSDDSPLIEILSDPESSDTSKRSHKSKGLVSPTFQKAQEQVMEIFGEIAQSIVDGDMDKLISFHAYGTKFTEFKDGALRNDGAANEAYERELFGVLVKNVVKFAAYDPKIAVYGGNVANLTFHSDFELDFGDGIPVPIKNQITLLFVRTNKGWKMVHEHHSPLSQEAMNSY